MKLSCEYFSRHKFINLLHCVSCAAYWNKLVHMFTGDTKRVKEGVGIFNVG